MQREESDKRHTKAADTTPASQRRRSFGSKPRDEARDESAMSIVVRGVVGAHPPLGPDHLRHVEPGCALVGTRRPLQQPPLKTHSLFRICVVVLSSITSRSVAAAAASSLMRFSPSPSCRGDEANPWLESAFITHFGCVSCRLFVCFPQSIVIACVSHVGFRGVSSLLVFLMLVSADLW